MGSLAFYVGGYSLPFLASAVIELIAALLILFLVSSRDMEQDTEYMPLTSESPKDSQSSRSSSEDANEAEKHPISLAQYSIHLSFINAALPSILHSSGFSLLQVATGPYLSDMFGVTGSTVGFYFLTLTGLAVIAAPIAGVLTDKGHGGRIYTLSTLIATIAYAFLFLPRLIAGLKNKVYFLFWLTIIGLTYPFALSTDQFVFETLAYRRGFTDSNGIKVVTAGCAKACLGTGRVVGSSLVGGIFLEYFGFYNSCLLSSILFVISSVSWMFSFVEMKLYAKTFYKPVIGKFN